MQHTKTFAAIAVLALSATGALANNNATIRGLNDLKDGTPVAVVGTVDDINHESEFTLRDATGTINVDIEGQQSVVLQKGQQVTVRGNVDRDITGTDINATSIEVSQNMGQAIEDTIEANTNVSFKGAAPSTVQALPKTGLVKLQGRVSAVENEKEFTLTDDTGSIDVNITSDKAAALKQGADVTVVGYVNDGMMGRDINASDVYVAAN